MWAPSKLSDIQVQCELWHITAEVRQPVLQYGRAGSMAYGGLD